jgi:putative ABC transport system substrate-binding protein
MIQRPVLSNNAFESGRADKRRALTFRPSRRAAQRERLGRRVEWTSAMRSEALIFRFRRIAFLGGIVVRLTMAKVATVVVLLLLAAPLASDAQPSAKVARIGYLSVAGGAGSPLAEAFREGLRDLGYVEGRNITIEFRAAEGSDQLPALAAELVQLRLDAIVAFSSVAAAAVKRVTTTIPVVMVSSGDPVATGLVGSLARPGGNITGLTALATDLSGKRLELLREAVPALSRVAVLWNSRDDAMTDTFMGIQAAALSMHVTILPLRMQEAKDIDSAIAAMTQERPDALFMITDVLTRKHTRQVVDFAARRQLPTLFEGKGPVAEGGLMSYGPNLTDMLRRAAYYVDRILKGAKPTDLPIEQPTKFELVINLKTAKMLGLTISPSLLLRADQIIEQ